MNFSFFSDAWVSNHQESIQYHSLISLQGKKKASVSAITSWSKFLCNKHSVEVWKEKKVAGAEIWRICKIKSKPNSFNFAFGSGFLWFLFSKTTPTLRNTYRCEIRVCCDWTPNTIHNILFVAVLGRLRARNALYTEYSHTQIFTCVCPKRSFHISGIPINFTLQLSTII